MNSGEFAGNARDSFVVYRSFFDACTEIYDNIPPLMRAIFEYGLDGKEPIFERGAERAIWKSIKPQLDANWRRYLNSLKGGAPEGNQNARGSKNNQETTKAQPNENENDNNNEKDNANANALVPSGQRALDEFSLGLALLRKGYIIKAADLHSKYARAAAANNPVSYATKGLTKAADPAALNVAAKYLEATGCRDTRALELYGAKMTEENGARVLEISCTAAARDAIGTAGQNKAQGYLQSIGATAVNFWCNGQ